MNAKEATFQILDAYRPRDRFTGYDLFIKVKIITGEIHYPDTYLRYLRQYQQKDRENYQKC